MRVPSPWEEKAFEGVGAGVEGRGVDAVADGEAGDDFAGVGIEDDGGGGVAAGGEEDVIFGVECRGRRGRRFFRRGRRWR